MSAGEDEFRPSVTSVIPAGTCDPLSTDGKRRSMVSNSRKPPGISSGTERAMSMILIFTGKWNRWYRALRYGNGFGLFNSARLCAVAGAWLSVRRLP